MVSLPFVLTCLLLAVVPGPSLAVLINQTVRHGRGAGLATVLGNTTGLLLWAVASAFGLSALIQASEVAFVVLKVVGAVYLCWLGVRTLVRSRATATPAEVDVPETVGSPLAAYRAGAITNLANPKAAALYLALLPQFLPADGNVLADTFVLAAVQMAISASWYALVVVAIGMVRRTLARPAVKARIEQISGLVLVGLGLRMALLGRTAV